MTLRNHPKKKELQQSLAGNSKTTKTKIMPSQGTVERKVWRHGGKSIYYYLI